MKGTVPFKTLSLVAAALVAVAIFATGPRNPRETRAPTPDIPAQALRGTFHIHTTRSDGALEKPAIAAAAARAGLQFAIFTDHGDGTRTPDPPAYMQGVLCIDAVEISTNGGHYVALGIPAAPYPLGGDADAVAEDVARLGGFGVAAHPFSARAELAWSDWTVPIDGLEWLNADSEWRDESRTRIAHALIDYLWRPAGALASLLDRPVEALARWDQLNAERPIVALAGHDAHGGLGAETDGTRGRRLHVPSYEASFRTFSIYVTPSSPLSGNAAQDADDLLRAIRQGHVFTAIDAIAAPAALDFSATGATTVRSGDVLPMDSGPARFNARASIPAGARMVLLRNGGEVAESSTGVLSHEASLPGVYRVEIRVDGAPGSPPVPWIVSNSIFHGARPQESRPSSAEPISIVRLMQTGWRVESSPDSSGTAASDGHAISFTYRLKEGEKASQFVALVVDLRLVPEDVGMIVLRARAAQPIRVSAQLRFANQDGDRWGRSIYLDASEREVRIPVASMRPAQVGKPRPPTSSATSLLFVVDLTNATPGAEGSVTLSDVALARQGR